jgi:predicted DNA-binding transcriptional regulator AlpA
MQPLTLHTPNGPAHESEVPPPKPTPTAPVLIQPIAPLLVGRVEAAKLCGLSPGTWDRHSSAGLVPAPRRIGGRPLWSIRELEDWIAAGCPDRRTWESIKAAERRTAR